MTGVSATAFARSAAALIESVEELTDAYMVRLVEEDAEWVGGRPEFIDIYREIARSSIREELTTFRDGGRPPDAAPDVDLEFARAAARLGAPATVLGDAYRRGHECHWEGWFRIIEERETDPEARRALLQQGSDFFFAYATRLSRLTLEEYTRERDLLLRDREHRRMALVGDLLAGRDVPADELGYDLSLTHVACVAWGEAAGEAVRAVAERLERQLLLVAIRDNTFWAWLGGSPLDGGARRTLARLQPTGGARMAFGEPELGPDGFRVSHQQSLRAEHSGRRSGAPVTRYADIALEALAATDEGAARAFVARELSGLDGDEPRSVRLRETLRAYFAAGQNAAATAAALEVHEQTVAQRLRAVEERTGRAVASRRAELETALRLRDYLG